MEKLTIVAHIISGKLNPEAFLMAGLQVVAPVVLVAGVFLAEIFCLGWRRSSLCEILAFRSQSVRSDVVVAVLKNASILKLLAIPFTFGLGLIGGAAFRTAIETHTGLNFSMSGIWMPLQFVMYFLAYTFCDYWAHRISHSRVFWPIHRFHHAADEFSIVTADRTHPGDGPSLLLLTFAMSVVDASPLVIATLAPIIRTIRYVIHTRIDSDFGWVGRVLVMSPLHHRLHHIRDFAGGAGNYGLIPLWDWLFGTLRGTVSQSVPVGVPEPYRHGAWFLPDMLRDYGECCCTIYDAACRWLRRNDFPRSFGIAAGGQAQAG